jgi:hypothetical protein
MLGKSSGCNINIHSLLQSSASSHVASAQAFHGDIITPAVIMQDEMYLACHKLSVTALRATCCASHLQRLTVIG